MISTRGWGLVIPFLQQDTRYCRWPLASGQLAKVGHRMTSATSITPFLLSQGDYHISLSFIIYNALKANRTLSCSKAAFTALLAWDVSLRCKVTGFVLKTKRAVFTLVSLIRRCWRPGWSRQVKVHLCSLSCCQVSFPGQRGPAAVFWPRPICVKLYKLNECTKLRVLLPRRLIILL